MVNWYEGNSLVRELGFNLRNCDRRKDCEGEPGTTKINFLWSWETNTQAKEVKLLFILGSRERYSSS